MLTLAYLVFGAAPIVASLLAGALGPQAMTIGFVIILALTSLVR